MLLLYLRLFVTRFTPSYSTLFRIALEMGDFTCLCIRCCSDACRLVMEKEEPCIVYSRPIAKQTCTSLAVCRKYTFGTWAVTSVTQAPLSDT